MRRAITFILLFMILFSACGAQGEDFLLGVEPEPSEITPA